MTPSDIVKRHCVSKGSDFRIAQIDPDETCGLTKSEGQKLLAASLERLDALQEQLYADRRWAVLIILQGLDASGKDGVIEHVMSGVNPQGCEVTSFKAPSSLELRHDFLWRTTCALPERGEIGIFNRSYYEEVLVVRVHPEILNSQQLPPEAKTKHIWQRRFEEINNYERYLTRNGIVILKFFLNVSREKQRSRFLKRINTPEKNWKFSLNDVKERAFWDDYMAAYEDMFNHTSTEEAPWYIIPADNKWFMRTAVADVIITKLESLNLSYPTVTEEHRQNLLKAKTLLEQE